jgi:glyoxylase-like metal-dependent hydrolase (beta-lactamase superfamily II)
MKLAFPGTRDEIEPRTGYRMHSCFLVEGRVLINCGADWLGKLRTLQPEAIVLTHAHPDHVGGLAHGAPCPVYATAEGVGAIKALSLAGTDYDFFPAAVFQGTPPI